MLGGQGPRGDWTGPTRERCDNRQFNGRFVRPDLCKNGASTLGHVFSRAAVLPSFNGKSRIGGDRFQQRRHRDSLPFGCELDVPRRMLVSAQRYSQTQGQVVARGHLANLGRVVAAVQKQRLGSDAKTFEEPSALVDLMVRRVVKRREEVKT